MSQDSDPDISMLRFLLAALVALAVTATLADRASAHPHVWVTMHADLIYAPDGSITGVRHAWTFDDMFSAFAVQGLPQKTKGEFTRAELASLAEVNISSLKDFDYFTFAKENGKKAEFDGPKDYWLDYKDSVLTLHFTLPLKQPAKPKTLVLEVYDPSYFVDFAYAEKDAVKLVGAPASCSLATVKLDDADLRQSKQVTEAMFNDPNVLNNWGAQFANRITVRCP